MLQEKIDCFEKFYKVPSNYYECIEKTDDKMSKNSISLQRKFQSLDVYFFDKILSFKRQKSILNLNVKLKIVDFQWAILFK